MVYSSHRPEVHQLFQCWRKIADGYDPERIFLGETWEFDFGRLGDYYGRETPELHMGFNFPFALSGLRAPQLAAIVDATTGALPTGATPVWTASNHDIGRFPSRWCKDDPRAVKAALVLLTTLPGTLVLYYGDELGMGDVEVPLELRVDEMSLVRPERPGRDRCRTPMPWAPGENGGFAPPGVRPWLPLGEHTATNLQTEQEDPLSVLNFCRALVALRRSRRAGQAGAVETVLLDEKVWAFRVAGTVAVLNLSGERARAKLGLGRGLHVLAATGARSGPCSAELDLGPWEALVLAES
jgi:alpha-glucosidase